METHSVREDAMKIITGDDIEEAYDYLQNRQVNVSFFEDTKVGFGFEHDADDEDLGLRIMLEINDHDTDLEFESRFDPQAMIYPGDVAVDLPLFHDFGKRDGYLAALTAYLSYYTTITVIYDESASVLNSVRFELDIMIPLRPRFTTELSTYPARFQDVMRFGVEEKTAGQQS